MRRLFFLILAAAPVWANSITETGTGAYYGINYTWTWNSTPFQGYLNFTFNTDISNYILDLQFPKESWGTNGVDVPQLSAWGETSTEVFNSQYAPGNAIIEGNDSWLNSLQVIATLYPSEYGSCQPDNPDAPGCVPLPVPYPMLFLQLVDPPGGPNTSPTPEPATFAMGGTAIIGLWFWRRRKTE